MGSNFSVFNSFVAFLATDFVNTIVPYMQVPSGLAELSLCLWLLIAGVNRRKWETQQEHYKELSAVCLRSDAVR
jgi:hypothetical protein